MTVVPFYGESSRKATILQGGVDHRAALHDGRNSDHLILITPAYFFASTMSNTPD
jgi:hypothetical protein